MSTKHGWGILVLSFALFLLAIAVKYLCVLNSWDTKGVDTLLVQFSLVVAGFGAGVLMAIDISKGGE